MSKPVVTFDFDDTLCMRDGTPNFNMIDLVHKYASLGYKCYVVTSRNKDHETFSWMKKNQLTHVKDFIRDHEIPIKQCHFTNHEPKGPILQKLNSIRHYDNMDEELESAKEYGIEAVRSLPLLLD
jgi:acid phosphatase class B